MFRFSWGRRALRKSVYNRPPAPKTGAGPGPKVPLAGLAHALGFSTWSVYGLMQPQFRSFRYNGWPATRLHSLPPRLLMLVEEGGVKGRPLPHPKNPPICQSLTSQLAPLYLFSHSALGV